MSVQNNPPVVHCAPGECWVEVSSRDAVSLLSYLYTQQVYTIRTLKVATGTQVARLCIPPMDVARVKFLLAKWSSQNAA